MVVSLTALGHAMRKYFMFIVNQFHFNLVMLVGRIELLLEKSVDYAATELLIPTIYDRTTIQSLFASIAQLGIQTAHILCNLQ